MEESTDRDLFCSKCNHVYEVKRPHIDTVVLENKTKHFDNFIKDFLVHILSDDQIKRGIKYINHKIYIAKNGEGSRNKGKWRSVSFQRFESELAKWIKEFLGIESVLCKSATFELLNRMFGKPLLTKDELTRLGELFHQYILYLFSLEIKLTVNYNFFFDCAFKTLHIDSLILNSANRDKEKMDYLNTLWRGFLKSRFFKDHFIYVEPKPSCIEILYTSIFISTQMAEDLRQSSKKQIEPSSKDLHISAKVLDLSFMPQYEVFEEIDEIHYCFFSTK